MFFGKKVGLLCSGGGIAGSYIAGVVTEFFDAGITGDRFKKITMTSVSSLVVPSYALGSIHAQLRIWLEGYLKKMLNWKRPLRPLDLEYLMNAAKEVCPLNIRELRRLPMPLEVTVTCCDTGESQLIDLRTVDDPHAVMIASAALPQFHDPVPLMIDGVIRPCVDGGMSRELPIRRMMRDVERVVVILTCPKEERTRPLASPWRVLACPRPWRHRALRTALSEMHERYNESMDIVLDLERQKRAIVIAPQKPLIDVRGRSCFRWILDTNPDGINRAIALGRQDAKHAITTLSLTA